MPRWHTNREALLGLAMLVIGLVFFVSSTDIEVLEQGGIGPRVFPMGGSLLLAGLGLLQLAGARPEGSEGQLAAGILPILALATVSVAYIAAIAHLGYLVSTALAAPAVLCLFGIRSVAGLVLAAIFCPAAYHLIFFVGLGVFPPYGLWFDLLDVIQGY